MNPLAELYSYIDGKKRQLRGLLSDPVETINQGLLNFRDDQNNYLNLFENAYPGVFPGSKTVLNTPEQISKLRKQYNEEATNRAFAATVPSSYRGKHTAPMKDNGAPLHRLTDIYPDDIYSSKAAQYYGHYGDNSMADRRAIMLMQAAKDRPNMPVTMYRAVPYEKTVSEQIAELEKQMATYLRRGNVPAGSYLTGDDWYSNAARQKEKLLNLVEQQKPDALKINNGDWVTLSREYAKEHGEGALNGKYKILSQKVPARKLFTDGNSIQEFGYDESGKALIPMLGLTAGAASAGLLADEETRKKFGF